MHPLLVKLHYLRNNIAYILIEVKVINNLNHLKAFAAVSKTCHNTDAVVLVLKTFKDESCSLHIPTQFLMC